MSKQAMVRTVMAAALCAMSAGALADGGRVVAGEGAILLRGGAMKEAVERGTVLQSGDTLATGFDGRVEWWMEDDSVFTIAPNSEFRIESFTKADKNSSGTGKVQMRLNKGGFRTISGIVGKPGHGSYVVNTPMATIGVDGTAYATMLCQNSSCVGKGNKPLPDGLYLAVDEGKVRLTNQGGTLEVTAHQIAFVSGGGVAATIVAEGPSTFNELTWRRTPIEFELEIDRDIPSETPASPS
jgi:hypothetical protein